MEIRYGGRNKVWRLKWRYEGTHGKWCKSIEKNTPKLKFGSNPDIDVLNLNPRIRIEILLRFYKIQDGGQDGRPTHFDTYLHF